MADLFFYISGVVVSILSVLAIAIMIAIWIDVRFLGAEIHLAYRRDIPSEEDKDI